MMPIIFFYKNPTDETKQCYSLEAQTSIFRVITEMKLIARPTAKKRFC